MELDDAARILVRGINKLTGAEPGWQEVTGERQLPDWYGRALWSAALLARGVPTLAVGDYKDGQRRGPAGLPRRVGSARPTRRSYERRKRSLAQRPGLLDGLHHD